MDIFSLLSLVFCRVYIAEHSYISIKTKVSTSAQEILKIVAEKFQHSQEDLVLVAVSFSGGKSVPTVIIASLSLHPWSVKRGFRFSSVMLGLFPFESTARWPLLQYGAAYLSVVSMTTANSLRLLDNAFPHYGLQRTFHVQERVGRFATADKSPSFHD